MSDPILWREFYWWRDPQIRPSGMHRLWMFRDREAAWIDCADFLTDPRPEKDHLRVGDMAVDFWDGRPSIENVTMQKILWEENFYHK